MLLFKNPPPKNFHKSLVEFIGTKNIISMNSSRGVKPFYNKKYDRMDFSPSPYVVEVFHLVTHEVITMMTNAQDFRKSYLIGSDDHIEEAILSKYPEVFQRVKW